MEYAIGSQSARGTIDLTPVSKTAVWTGRVLSAVPVLFLLVDGAMKLPNLPGVVEASAQLGVPANVLPGIGVTLLVCTVLYIVPRTAALGAVLLTGYLGGAIATQVRVGGPLFNDIFPLILAALLWGGLFLRDARLRVFLPWRRGE